jgi:hypothetical protein
LLFASCAAPTALSTQAPYWGNYMEHGTAISTAATLSTVH